MDKRVYSVVAVVLVVGFVILIKVLPERQKTDEFNALTTEYPEITECNNFQDPYLKGNCYREIAVENNDTRLCSFIPTLLGRSECLGEIALQDGNPQTCKEIENQTYIDGCVYTVAISLRDASFCRMIHSNSSRTRCLAKTIANPEACSGIENQEGRDWCVKKLAIETYTAELCSRIVTLSIRDACYYEYVKRNTIASANCKKIVDDKLRQKCWGVATILQCPIDEFMPFYGEPL